MTINEIYNLVIALVPSMTAIVSTFTIFFTLIKSFNGMRNSFKDKNKDYDEKLDILAQSIINQQKQIDETNRKIKELSLIVSKVIDHVDKEK